MVKEVGTRGLYEYIKNEQKNLYKVEQKAQDELESKLTAGDDLEYYNKVIVEIMTRRGVETCNDSLRFTNAKDTFDEDISRRVLTLRKQGYRDLNIILEIVKAGDDFGITVGCLVYQDANVLPVLLNLTKADDAVYEKHS